MKDGDMISTFYHGIIGCLLHPTVNISSHGNNNAITINNN